MPGLMRALFDQVPDAGAAAGAAGAAGAGSGAGAPNAGQAAKTFTQDELDRIIAERLHRAVPANLDELRSKAAEFDKLQEGQKSELQKAQERAAQAERAGAEALAKAGAALKRAALLAAATAQKAIDPETVAQLLAASGEVTVDGDAVAGADEAVKKLLKEKPFLATPGATTTGGQAGGQAAGAGRRAHGEFGGDQPPSDIGARIRELEAKREAARAAGNTAQMRELKDEIRTLQLQQFGQAPKA